MRLDLDTLARTTGRRALRTALLATAIVGALVPNLAAQSFFPESDERGWIGMSFEVLTDEWGRASAVMITDVSVGSPAAEAGLRPGDRVLAINELNGASELAQLTQRLRLDAGDRVIMELERGGSLHRVRLTAAARPDDFEATETVAVLYEVDMVDTWVRAMDSLRIELVRGGRGQNVQVRSRTDDEGIQRIRIRSTPRGRSAQVTVVTGASGRTVQAPFEFFVFRGEEHDSLRQEMVDLNSMMAELEVRLVERQAQVRRVQGRDDVHLREDAEFVRITALLDEASGRTSGLETAMAVAARETAGLRYTLRSAPPSPPGIQSAVTVQEPAPRAEFRPLTPYLLGRNRVAGAEVTDLEPQLAQYFGVGGGVLVLGVAEGTPAALAGIVPGDVIVRVDQVGIRSVEDLRFGVSMAGETLPVALIRQGVSVQVLLRRQ